ncbi:organoarsenical effux MFS transporter ArsJ [Motiliproteus sp. MSK22-1]|uniref:organoarsenical effux MFS transporter ArsJ n=1 Tax=Motiliproteus sp. MSK22-1 TaxID=1897630 RepID=UPI0009756CEB|nr:organoarsenical effux MFS transporter ArsJ [Motiliproteus sp. MSK22-1]OMH27981.1 MFS transporter permease [Motiliproteus sp. MSK22-1]
MTTADDLNQQSPDTVDSRQYLLVTGNYWAFTLTDGALRMLVVLHFHQLGYSPLAIAMLFLFYEIFGVITNLVGGWLGAHIGLNHTMNIGLAMQIIALAMLTVPSELLSIPYVMAAQALSGVAKDLNKMSAKSSIKLLAGSSSQSTLYKWVAVLTGSKNTLKGAGFFLGGALLTGLGFQNTLIAMATALSLVLISSMLMLKKGLGKITRKTKFSDIFSKSYAVNSLSGARLFLFGARDVWFVIALPVFLSTELGWEHTNVGGFLALWIIGYGVIQAFAPRLTGKRSGQVPDGRSAFSWALVLALIPALIAITLITIMMSEPWLSQQGESFGLSIDIVIIVGLLIFGLLFAVNSSLHSFLIVSYAKEDGVSLDIGFYYMANAMGRLIGTVLSGWLFQSQGLILCLWVSSAFLLLTALISLKLPRHELS